LRTYEKNFNNPLFFSNLIFSKQKEYVYIWGDYKNLVPKAITELEGIIQISSGESHSLALKNDGTVWAWGRNAIGQLGDGKQKFLF